MGQANHEANGLKFLEGSNSPKVWFSLSIVKGDGSGPIELIGADGSSLDVGVGSTFNSP